MPKEIQPEPVKLERSAASNILTGVGKISTAKRKELSVAFDTAREKRAGEAAQDRVPGALATGMAFHFLAALAA